MKTHTLHSWNVSLENAKAIQKNLRAWIVTEGPCLHPKLIGRITLTSTKESDQSATVQACVTIQSYPSMTLLERKVAIKTSKFPLQPGLYSFRKVPAVVAALNKLNRVPDLFICDGRGITGEDSFGVASHVGLITSIPTIGIRTIKPKHMLETLGAERGSYLRIFDSGQIAAAVRLIDGLDPVQVAPAHKINLENAVAQALAYVPATISSQDYLQALYPESGTKKAEVVQLSVLKSATGR
jgi:deoxyribonuclease V